MAGQTGHQTESLNSLLNRPYPFDFFQAVRLLQKHFSMEGGTLRFKSLPQLAFPTALIEKIKTASTENGRPSLTLFCSFLNILGQSSPLPEHLTEYVLTRIDQKDESIYDFIDLFNERLYQICYTIWEKSAFFLADMSSPQSRNLTLLQFIQALSGQSPSIAEDGPSHSVLEQVMYNAGLFSAKTRPPEGLISILKNHLGLTCQIHHFSGQWLDIPKHTRSCLRHSRASHYNQLGQSTLLGQRFWATQHHFEIEIQEVDAQTLANIVPSGRLLHKLDALVKQYWSAEYSYHITLHVMPSSVRTLCLGRPSARLGWTSWLANSNRCNPETTIRINVDNVFDHVKQLTHFIH